MDIIRELKLKNYNDKINILDCNLGEISEIVSSYGFKSFRGKQIFKWLSKGVTSFQKMKNIPGELIKELSKGYYISIPTIEKESVSKVDGTTKCLFSFNDKSKVESVFMKYDYGNSICISSQVGCKMGCKFCASTKNGLFRNLSPGEMLGQVLMMKNLKNEDIRHVVIMGMGEPFDNYDAVSKFINIIHDKEGYNLSYRNITVSTSGIIPMINKFSKEFKEVNLAISLHSINNQDREKIMPIAKKYKYEELISACKEYTLLTHRRISFEYVLIENENDSIHHAKELGKLLGGWLAHINLIPLNETEGSNLKKPSRNRVIQFKKVIESYGVPVSIRRTLGSDISAACGQLRNDYELQK